MHGARDPACAKRPRVVRGDAGLAEMHAVGLEYFPEIETIVDHEPLPGIPGELSQLAAEPEASARRKLVVTELHRYATWSRTLDEPCDALEVMFAAKAGEIRDHDQHRVHPIGQREARHSDFVACFVFDRSSRAMPAKRLLG